MNAKVIGLLCTGIFTLGLQAQSLFFTSGVLSNDYNTVHLYLSGRTNFTVSIERLNPTNALWEANGNVTLDSKGTNLFTTSLIDEAYGFYRAIGTNFDGTNSTIYRSTNAYGAVVGELSSGYTLIGNLFSTENVSNILRDPIDGLQAQRWLNASNSYQSITYSALFESWLPSTISFDTAEGFFVRVPGETNVVKYAIAGLFGTNTISKSIPTGWSILCSPGYHVIETNSWRVDLLDNTNLGGLYDLPVISNGFNPQATIYKQLTTTPSYSTNTLWTTWTDTGTNTVIPLNITEGFWLNKPTNATWNINRTIW